MKKKMKAITIGLSWTNQTLFASIKFVTLKMEI